MSKADEFITNGTNDVPKIETCKGQLEKQLIEINKLDQQIAELMDEEGIENEIFERFDFESAMQETICRINALFNEKSVEKSTQETHQTQGQGAQIESVQSTASNVVHPVAEQMTLDQGEQPTILSNDHPTTSGLGQPVTSKHVNKTKLPKLSLPRFSGEPTKWLSFWDSFSSAIHENEDLNDIDKFQYLRSLLEGSAVNAISGLSLTNSNYKEAIDLLQERYGNKQVIISRHMESLMQLPAVSDDDDLKKLRQLYDKTESTVRSLNGIGILQDTYGTFLTPTIMAKLPKELRLIISRKLSDEWDLKSLLTFFREELQLREKCVLGATATKERKPEYVNRRQQSTTGSFYTDSGKSSKDNTRHDFWCTFCKGNHKSVSCGVVTEPDARRSILRRKGKCFNCLQSGHISNNCSSGRKCYRCGGKHHTSICSTQVQKQSGFPKQEETPKTGQSVSTNLYITRSMSNEHILLQTARAPVHSPNSECPPQQTRILFDSCSQKSYITTRLRKKLNLKSVGLETLMIKTFGNEQPSLKKCNLVQLAVECVDNLMVYINAYEVDFICSPLSNHSVEIAQQNFPYLQGLQFADVSPFPEGGSENLEIDLMIGADFYWSFIQSNVVRGESGNGPVALSTRLGYVLSGPLGKEPTNTVTTNLSTAHTMIAESVVLPEIPVSDLLLKKELAKFWDYETLGIKDREFDMYDDYKKTIKANESRYVVPLPFKQDHPLIPDNYTTVHHRLGSLVRRLKKSPDILREYDRVIKEQLRSDVIQVVDEEEVEPQPGAVHYIPHREVVRDDKNTTKLRVVYDASSKQFPQPSLNECLEPGPSLIPLIFDVLMRFRIRKIALVGDLEKAFLNVEITPEQRDLLRFLWIDDPFSISPKEVVLRFTRLVFGLVCSPFILNAVLRNHLTKYEANDPQFVFDVLKSLYVDDYASGEDSVSACFDLYQKLKKCFSEGGFNMRKWATNNSVLSELIRKKELGLAEKTNSAVTLPGNTHPSVMEEDEGYAKTTLNNAVCTDDEVKVMGVPWDRNSDVLKLKFDHLISYSENKPVTKRLILGTTARFFDPLGLLSPITVPLKCLFQELCRTGSGWDDPLDDQQMKYWEEVISDMKKTSEIEAPRCVLKGISSGDIESVELHGFSDASSIAYGGNVYLRVNASTGVSTQLLASKTRVAPLKGETIPRLELLGALTLAKLINSVCNSLDGVLKIDEIICWVDSQIVLWWIRGKGKQYKQFVHNRVTQIRSLVIEECWRYCPTGSNPADIASRGAKCSDLKSNRLWWNGPPHLKEERDQWPTNITCDNSEVADMDEVKCEEKRSEPCNTLLVAQKRCPVKLSEVIECERFSKLTKLLRVTVLVQRFIKNCRNPRNREVTVLTSEKTNSALTLWHKEVQLHLQEKNESLGIFEDDNGVLRCKGRIQNSTLPYSTKFPVLLPTKHHFTDLVILHSHDIVKHNGIRETLTEVRSSYWIVKGRQAVKRLLARCNVCKMLLGKPYEKQSTPPLPDFRVAEDPAFSRIGVDFAGPLYVKDIYRKAEMHKCYITVFTCASSRAIHLELVPDLTADSFIRALKRFIGRRGIPSIVVSDNGKTFCDSKVQNFVTQRNVVWKFNVPTASWWGGFFEICVKLVKRSLKKVIRNAKLSYEELETTLIEIEGVLNSRPLTYVYDEITEQPITPSCLVIGRRLMSQSISWHADERTSTSKTLGKRARYLERLLEHFRERWKREYLTGIREHQKLKSTSKSVRRILAGDIVHIQHDKMPRLQWRLGKVTRVFPGRDGIVRSAEVATLDPSKRVIHVKRPIEKLYPLEVRSEAEIKREELNVVNIKPVMDENIPAVVIGK